MTTMPPLTSSGQAVSPPANQSTSSRAKANALHQPFSWLDNELRYDAAANRDADILDAFRGIATCLQLVESSNLDRELADPDGPTPVLCRTDTGQLMRLAILVAKEWANKTERHIADRAHSAQTGSAK